MLMKGLRAEGFLIMTDLLNEVIFAGRISNF